MNQHTYNNWVKIKETFEKYGSEKLLDLVNISESDMDKVRHFVNYIDEIKVNINKIDIGEDLTDKLTREIKSFQRKLEDINLDKLAKIKRQKNLGLDSENIKKEIIEKSKGLNVEVN